MAISLYVNANYYTPEGSTGYVAENVFLDWANKIINVPKNLLTQVIPGVFNLDLDLFRTGLKDEEDSEIGMMFVDTHRHNTTVDIGNLTLARVIEIINGYTVSFEDGNYAVNLIGANSNVSEVSNVNQVSIRSQNSAGLIVLNGSGLSPEQSVLLAELHKLHGLLLGTPLVVTGTTRDAGASISQTIVDDNAGTVTVTRT